jgi:adenosylhomocysteine nucleosidase
MHYLPSPSTSHARRKSPSARTSAAAGNERTTLILGAMPSEVRLNQAQLTGRKSGTFAGFPYDTGRLRGRKVVVAVTGVGATNGAMVAALFAEHVRPAELIVTGTGSRFHPRVRTGDTVISIKTIHHAAGSLTDDGMVYRKLRGPLPSRMTSWFFRPDAQLLALAKSAVRTYVSEEIVVDGARYHPAVFTGVVTPSDLFGVSDAKIADMREKL